MGPDFSPQAEEIWHADALGSKRLEEGGIGNRTTFPRVGEQSRNCPKPRDAVFYVENGKVMLTVISKRGKEAIVAVLSQGSFFGESCLAGQPLRMATAKAVVQSRIIRVEKRVMKELLHQDPNLLGAFLPTCLPGVSAWKRTWWITCSTPANLLLLLANFQESKPIPLVAKISQETIAEMIGTTRSRVSFFMNRFRKLGFIEYNGGGMHVHSSLISLVPHN